MPSPIHLFWWIAVLTLVLRAGAPAHAQLPGETRSAQYAADGTIIVTAERPFGAALGNPQPARQLHPADIAAYGAHNVRELVDNLSLETRGSNLGARAPVVLLNGRRIFSFSEIGDIPAEAILRIDILAGEVARRYGNPIGSKVLNIVLRPSYSTRVAELAFSQATAGGRRNPDADITIARNSPALRWNLNVTAARSDMLLESQRRVAGGLGEYRSLLPQVDRFTIAGTAARHRPAGFSYSATARAEIRYNVDLAGPSQAPPASARAMRRERRDASARINASTHGQAAGWQWTLAAEAHLVTGDTRGDRAGAPAYLANVERTEFALDGLANRAIAQLPSGDAGLTLRFSLSESMLRSRSTLSPAPEVRFSRSRGTAYAALDLPLSSREQGRRGVGSLILGFGAQAVLADLQPVLFRLETSVNWSPIRSLNIGLGLEREEDAPSLEELGNPTNTLENITLFDFTRGETAIVRLRTGGNPSLGLTIRTASHARMTWQASRHLNVSGSYTRSRTAGLIGSFPAISREVELAFPGRFVRDPSGRLIELDQSPVNFRRATQEQFRWGLNWNLSVARPAQPRAGEPPDAREAVAALDRAARVNLSIFHSMRLRDDLRVREGLPRLDFLDGSIAGIAGARARHALEAQAAVGAGGLGVRFNGRIEGGSRTTTVNGGKLSFSSVARFDLRLFADLGQLMPRRRWTSGSRASLQFGNLLNSRARVRRSGGPVPEAFQPAYIDPLGRTVKFSLRRVF